MYYGYVYLITNLINNKKYVGLRSSSTFDSGYWGSGKLIRFAIAKYGKENFKQEVLKWCETAEELVNEEIKEILARNAKNSDEYYNLIDTKTPIGIGNANPFFGKSHTETAKQRISEKNKGKTWSDTRRKKHDEWVVSEDARVLFSRISAERSGIPLTAEHRKKIKSFFTDEIKEQFSKMKREFYLTDRGIEIIENLRTLAKDRFTGVQKTEEHRNRIATALTGKEHPWQDSINKNPEKIKKTAEKHRGMKRSAESKQRMSQARKGKPSSAKGKRFYYNPANPDEKILCMAHEAPIGWINGIYKKQ